MARCFLFDLNKMIVLKTVSGEDAVRRCEYWADILIPKDEFYVCGDMKRDLASFSELELRLLYRNLENREVMGHTYARVLEQVHDVMGKLQEDETTLGQLVKKLGKPLKEPDFTPVKEKPEPKSKQVGAIPSRPKEGSLTARVWEAADWLYSQQNPQDINSKSLRDDVIKVCTDNGVNPSTASTQYAKWKKALING